ncbi:hypothetical protein NLM27_08670 [Bradyrhizobium sp. CCGB12]|uniref:hypothetical protein n=1 Tax=Bradyrhizobium sp. CCGB12 TaxID=2949632 RepID=UPI0020B2CAA4|nr:hypothetical protein [Bradyrhizobium sp. CCGB12]MCP3388850.1 hypothetical protein [Bradyrhizobium sp. CCGB12]
MRLITFDTSSEDANIRRHLKVARENRLAAEAAILMARDGNSNADARIASAQGDLLNRHRLVAEPERVRAQHSTHPALLSAGCITERGLAELLKPQAL